jgi:hypothetical protein
LAGFDGTILTEMAARRVAVRVLVVQEGEWLSAQCLEYDLATQARTLDDLWYELQRILFGHIATRLREGKEPFADLPKAPQKYWDLFEQSKIPLLPPRLAFSIRKPGARILRPQVRVASKVA